MLNDKLHTKRQQVHISMFRNLLQLTNSVAIGFSYYNTINVVHI
jgi:hypothetical protein